jgi:hypothetical protein
MPRPHRPARPGASPGPRAGNMGRAPRPLGMALAAIVQPVSVHGAGGVPRNGRLPFWGSALPDSVAGKERVKNKKEALDELLRDAAAAPDLLAMRRAVMERMPGRGLAVLR